MLWIPSKFQSLHDIAPRKPWGTGLIPASVGWATDLKFLATADDCTMKGDRKILSSPFLFLQKQKYVSGRWGTDTWQWRLNVHRCSSLTRLETVICYNKQQQHMSKLHFYYTVLYKSRNKCYLIFYRKDIQSLVFKKCYLSKEKIVEFNTVILFNNAEWFSKDFKLFIVHNSCCYWSKDQLKNYATFFSQSNGF